MNPEVKQKWIDALRSGKYEQGSEKLRSVEGYCCLGVLCDLYAKEKENQWEFCGNEETNLQRHDYWYFDGEGEFLPFTVSDWAGLNTNNPKMRIVVEDDYIGEYFDTDEIANLNDSGYTFSKLADLIEEQL